MAKAKSEGLRIAAKALADLNMPDFDPQAFWVKSKVKFKTPFSIFPGIFSTLDMYQKDMTAQAFVRKGNWPPWVCAEIEEQVPCPHWSKFCFVDEETGITVSGAMDDCFKKTDGKLLISDNKLARYTEGQDKLLPLYEAQLNIYADICERTGMGVADQLQLVYHEPIVTLESDEVFESLYRSEEYLLRFNPRVVEMKRDPEMTRRLLKRAKEILSMETLPEPPGGKIGKDLELVLEMARAFNEGINKKVPAAPTVLSYKVSVDGKFATKVNIPVEAALEPELMISEDALVSMAVDGAKSAGGKGEITWESEPA